MMWPATFLPFVYGLGFTPPQQKKNKCEKRTSKNDMEVDSADTETHVHDGAGSSGTGTEASGCLLYTSPSPRDGLLSRMPSSA